MLPGKLKQACVITDWAKKVTIKSGLLSIGHTLT